MAFARLPSCGAATDGGDQQALLPPPSEAEEADSLAVTTAAFKRHRDAYIAWHFLTNVTAPRPFVYVVHFAGKAAEAATERRRGKELGAL